MLQLKVGDRVRSKEDGGAGTVMRREHDFEHPGYVIAWDDGEQRETAERAPKFGRTPKNRGRYSATMSEEERRRFIETIL